MAIKFRGFMTSKPRVSHKGWVYHHAYERNKRGPGKLLWTAAVALAIAAAVGSVPWTG